MTGRPTKLTPELQDALVLAIQNGASQKLACDYVGITPDSFQDWMKRGEVGEEPFSAFSASIKKAYASCGLADLKVIREAAKNGNWFAAAWRLERSKMYGQDYRNPNFADTNKAEAEEADSLVGKAATTARERLRKGNSTS